MKAKIALVTVSGKAYYMLANELKGRNIAFLSLTPQDDVPLGIRVAITTKEESRLIRHPNVLVYRDEMDPATIVDEAIRMVRGKRGYDAVVVGVDPGKTTGIAVLGDGSVLETFTCSSLEEAVRSILESSKKARAKMNIVKVGDGAPVYAKELLHLLDKNLPEDHVIEIVSEAGTSRSLGDSPHRRGARDAMSAVRIAERRGRVFPRRKAQ